MEGWEGGEEEKITSSTTNIRVTIFDRSPFYDYTWCVTFKRTYTVHLRRKYIEIARKYKSSINSSAFQMSGHRASKHHLSFSIFLLTLVIWWRFTLMCIYTIYNDSGSMHEHAVFLVEKLRSLVLWYNGLSMAKKISFIKIFYNN